MEEQLAKRMLIDANKALSLNGSSTFALTDSIDCRQKQPIRQTPAAQVAGEFSGYIYLSGQQSDASTEEFLVAPAPPFRLTVLPQIFKLPI